MPSNSLPDADLKLPEMKTKSFGECLSFERVFSNNSEISLMSIGRCSHVWPIDECKKNEITLCTSHL